MGDKNEELKTTLANAIRLARLYAENLKLISTEKTTVLLSSGVLAVVLLILAACALFFCSIAVVYLLASVLPIAWCFLIVGGFYILLGVVAVLLRTTLFVNPIARFLSRLFLTPPTDFKNKEIEKP